jgi:hypothetical protein
MFEHQSQIFHERKRQFFSGGPAHRARHAPKSKIRRTVPTRLALSHHHLRQPASHHLSLNSSHLPNECDRQMCGCAVCRSLHVVKCGLKSFFSLQIDLKRHQSNYRALAMCKAKPYQTILQLKLQLHMMLSRKQGLKKVQLISSS